MRTHNVCLHGENKNIYFILSYFCPNQSYYLMCPNIAGRVANSAVPYQTPHMLSSLVWVIAVCLWKISTFSDFHPCVAPDMRGYQGKSFLISP